MIRKFISIKNVGRFLSYGASKDVELKRHSLIFAENGRGKTTLCAILRSLQTGDAAVVKGRTTLGVADPAEIKILLADGSTPTFANGAWNTIVPNLAIFDSTFVAENVYSGDAVELDHKRKLYGVIVGKQGADLARRIEELDTASRDKSAEIRDKRAAVQALAQGFTPEVFVTLPSDAAIDEKITAQERELAAVRQADQIKTRAALSTVTLPALPTGLADLLAKTIEGVAADAERRIAAQIGTHAMHDRGEPWLSEGIGYIQGEACPFCGQGLEGIELIAAYKAYFGEGYAALRREIAALREQVASVLGDRAIGAVERTLDQNTATVEFWSGYCDITPPAMAAGSGDAIRALRLAALALLDRKAASPLEPIAPDGVFTAAQNSVAGVQEMAASYNASVTAANTVIAAKKTATQAADIRTVQAELTRLQGIKARHEPAGAAACQEFGTALTEKDMIENDKAAVRKTLDEYAAQVMGQYEKTINRLLDEFQAGFRITGTASNYAGGVVSSSYKIVINDTQVELGSADTGLDKPSFRNTLSSGDKSTLALAFFLAQLDHDPDKAAKTVIFDDPFNSQDGFRKDCTIQKIKRCGAVSTQVIVLSHDQDFLRRIWDRLPPAERKCLKLARVGLRDTTVVELDIEEATQAAFKAQRKGLLDFYHDNMGDPRDVVQKIRPVLESYCKILGGDLFAGNDTLGVIIGKIRNAGAGHQLLPMADGLEDLNEYTKRYHHGDNSDAATEPISDVELQGKVKVTLELTGGC